VADTREGASLDRELAEGRITEEKPELCKGGSSLTKKVGRTGGKLGAKPSGCRPGINAARGTAISKRKSNSETKITDSKETAV